MWMWARANEQMFMSVSMYYYYNHGCVLEIIQNTVKLRELNEQWTMYRIVAGMKRGANDNNNKTTSSRCQQKT